MYQHVLCVYPYRVELSCSRRFFPPLGLETIAAVLKPHARAIDVIDLRHDSGRTVDFLRPDTDLVCFSVNWERELDFVRGEIRSVPPGIPTIVGGRHATEDPEKWLADCPNVDILVRGDGEEIIEEIAAGRPLADVAGISYRPSRASGSNDQSGKGRPVHNPARQCGPVSDHIYPDRRLRRYAYRVVPGPGGTPLFDSIASSRGCPFNCTFCSFNRNPWGTRRGWSARSPESVVRELAEMDASQIAFVDDNFTHDMDRVDAICDLIIARGIRKRYVVNARVEIAKRPDVIRKMERAGFSALLIGIESAQDKSLRAMKKGFNTRQLREYFRVLRRTTMILHGYFIIGNVGETGQEMLAITPFARELGLDSITLCPLRNERHSGLGDLVARSAGYHIAEGGNVYSDSCPLERIQDIMCEINTRFYSPGQIWRIFLKGVRNRLVTPGIVARLPGFFLNDALRRRREKRTRLRRDPPPARP